MKGMARVMKRICGLFRKLRASQEGSVLIVVAVSLVALFGFTALVTDLGAAYNTSSRLQNALDSAVLAGVRELPAVNSSSPEWVAAENEAIFYAAANGLTITADDITPIYKNDDSLDKITGLRINKSTKVDYYFIKAFGIDSGTVSRSAAAGIVPAGGISGAVPLSITASALRAAINAGAVDNLTIKASTNTGDIGIDCTGESGWFGALRFDGSGASVYEDLIAYGYDSELHLGQILDMENGNMSGPTMSGFTARYDACTDGCTADSYEPDCPRLVYVPVVEVHGNKQVKIVSFAVFFLNECGGNGNNSYIKATYVDDYLVSNTGGGSGTEDFGVYTTRILD